MPFPLLGWAALAGAGWTGYKLFGEKTTKEVESAIGAGPPGNAAQVGDDVYVSPAFLSQATLPPLPPGTLYVIINVKGADAARLQGPIVGFGDQKIPSELGSFVVQRTDPFKVVRNGKAIAFQPGAKIGAEG